MVAHWSTLELSDAKCPEDGYCGKHEGLTVIPNDIPPLTSHIHLQNNRISDIKPRAFIKNTNCVMLRLEFNNLTTIRWNMWDGLGALKYLCLWENNIKTVEEKGFHNLPQLERLYLDSNKLTTITEDMWEGLQALRHLSLSQNIIELVEGGGFNNLPQLQSLDLDNNKLTSLNQDIFYPDHPARVELKLFGNPLKKGDQRLCWIQRGKTEGWITSRLTTTIESLECSQTAKPEVQSNTESTTRSDGVPGSPTRSDGVPVSRSNRSVTGQFELFKHFFARMTLQLLMTQ